MFTVDFVIKNDLQMMVFIHVLIHGLRGCDPEEKEDGEGMFDDCLRQYRWVKFRMKLSYFAWMRNLTINELVMKTIIQSLTEIRTMAVYQLQKLKAKDGPETNFQVIPEESIINTSKSEKSSDSFGSSDKDSDGFSVSDKSVQKIKKQDTALSKKLTQTREAKPEIFSA